jgi:hypothetical protein
MGDNMEQGRVVEELWKRQIASYLEAPAQTKVMDAMAFSLTDMNGYSIYDVLGVELARLLEGLDSLGLEYNTGTMYAQSHRYNKIKYAVMDAAQISLINVVRVDNAHINAVQFIDEPTEISFIFNLSYSNILYGLPAQLYAMLRIVEHVCEGCMVSTDKNINLYVNIGYGHIEPRFTQKAQKFVKTVTEECNGLENREDSK